MTTQLVRYEEMRHAVEQCAKVDEAAELHDKAKALQAYARQRDDYALEGWVAEIRFRAEVQIGILSQDLEKAEAHGGDVWLPAGGKSKRDALNAAGISTSTAHRYESLAGDRRARAEAALATDAYFAEVRARGERPTFEGLFAVRQAAEVRVVGPPPPLSPEQLAHREEILSVHKTWDHFLAKFRPLGEWIGEEPIPPSTLAYYSRLMSEHVAARDLGYAYAILAFVRDFILAMEAEHGWQQRGEAT